MTVHVPVTDRGSLPYAFVDAFATFGDPNKTVSALMTEQIVRELRALGLSPNTYATGTGEYADEREFSTVLFWAELTPAQAAHVRTVLARNTDDWEQEAFGFVVIPAGSALNYN